MPKKPAQFLKAHTKGKKIALFCTQGAPKDSEFAQKALQNAKKQSPDAEVVATFNCKGQVTQRILDSASRNPKYQSWAESVKEAAGHPDQKDLKEAKEFARKTINRIKR